MRNGRARRLSVRPLSDLVRRRLEAEGLGRPEADATARHLVQAELWERATHGLLRLPAILRALRKPRGPLRIVSASAAHVLLDGGNRLGYPAAERATDVAIRKSATHPIALGAVRNVRHTGLMGYYAHRMARAGRIGIALGNCYALVAPPGDRRPVLGTNPIALGFPASPAPVVCDLSTAGCTYGDILKARAKGEPLAPGGALDEQGRPTSDPEAALRGALLPAGGGKGYALGLAIQILAGPLLGAPATPPEDEGYGFLAVALNPRFLGGARALRRGIARLVAALRASGDGVRIPGERGRRAQAALRRRGIPLPPPLAAILKGA